MIKYISVEELRNSFESFELIDVRDSEDYFSARIQGATFLNRNDWSDFIDHITWSQKEFGKKIVLYCGSEFISKQCARKLYINTDVYVLQGGLDAWIIAGYPVFRGSSEPDDDRYSPQIRLIGREGQEKLKKGRVAIIGLGGLGCPAVQYLSAAGVGNIVLVDGDRVSASNLHRQIIYNHHSDIGKKKVYAAEKNLGVIGVKYHAYDENLTINNASYILKGCNVVLDCTDSFSSRFIVHEAATRMGIPVICGAVQGSTGELIVFDSNGGPCYRCLIPILPEEFDTCSSVGVLGPVCGIIGSMQANEAIKILSGYGIPSYGQLIRTDFATGQTIKASLIKSPDCPLCKVMHGKTENIQNN